MRHLFLISLFVLLTTLELSAQAPKGINYQGVARDHEGKAIASKKISIRISILKNSADGDTEYKETHEVTTNTFGLFTLVIGQGQANTGSFDFISWAVGTKWLQIELDPNGSNSFQLIGSQQLMSVPYALYAQYSGNGLIAGQGIAITNGVINNTGDANATNELNTSVTFGADHKLKITDAGGTKEADLSSLVAPSQNLAQILTKGNDAGGQKITNLALPTSASDAVTKSYVDSHQDGDASNTNEIQDLSLTGNNLKLTNNPTATSINLSGYLDNTDNQDLTLSGNVLSLTNDASSVDLSVYAQNINQVLTKGNDAGGVKLTNLGPPTVNTDAATKIYVDNLDATDGDKSATNEIQNINQVLTVNNNAGGLKLTNLGAPTTNTDATTKLYVDNLDTADGDKSSTNEIQNIGQVLTQSNDAGGIKLTNLGTPTVNSDATTKLYVDNLDATDGDKSSTNEIQNIGQVLTQSNDAGGIKLTNLGAPTTNTDATTKLYVDNLDAADGDKSSANEIQNIGQVLTQGNDAGGIKLTNLGTPTVNSDATTKLYVDNLDAADGDKSSTNELQSLTQVMSISNDAGNRKIQNVLAPTTNLDVANKQYVDAADANLASLISTTYAFKVNFGFTAATAGSNVLVVLGAEDIDSFNVINSNAFTAPQTGTYLFYISATAGLGGPPLKLRINSGSSFVTIKRVPTYPNVSIPHYIDTVMLQLNANDTVDLVTDVLLGENFSGVFFGYKL